MLWWARRAPEDKRARAVASLVLGVGPPAFGIAESVPGWGVVPVLVGTPAQVSIVSTIDQYGPYWIIGYLVSGAAVLAAVWSHRLLPTAHLLGSVVGGAFAFAVWWGTFASEPNRSLVTGVFVSGWAAWHIALMLAYTEQLLEAPWKP